MAEETLANYKYLFDSDLLRGKVAFVTGGGTGIGFTIVEIFMRHGCTVVIASRRIDLLKRSAALLEKATGGRCVPMQIDVRKPETVIAAMEQTLSMFGKIDILVNNAAGNFLCPAADLSFNAFKTVLEIDTIGTFNASKIVFEKWMGKHGGVIINISATLHQKATLLQTHAGAAKAAIDAITAHLAAEWGPSGVRVVGVAPGPIADTEGMRKLSTPAYVNEMVRHIPSQRLGKRVDIGHSVLFLASAAADYITGQTLICDGGAFFAQPGVANLSKL